MRSFGSSALHDKEKPAGVSSARRLFRLFVSASLACSGCDAGSPAIEASSRGPLVHVVATIPETDAVDVPVGQSIRIQFDRFLSPLSVLRQSICIASVGPATLASGRNRCEQFPAPEYDPVDRVAVFKPSHPLLPGVRYSVRVFSPASDEDPDGIRAFDGAPLGADHVFSFTTERRSSCESDADCKLPSSCGCEGQRCTRMSCQRPEGEPPRSVDYCDGPRQLLVCQGDSDACPGLLRLGDDDVRALLGQVAPATARLPDPSMVARSGMPFGVNMPYIDPGFPAHSYLLWELVLAMHESPGESHEGAVAPWIPRELSQPIAEGELTRLRRALRLGELSLSPDARISPASVRMLSAWIAEGAPVRDCP